MLRQEEKEGERDMDIVAVVLSEKSADFMQKCNEKLVFSFTI